MNVTEATNLANEILMDLDELPEEADEFSESVREKVTGMIEWMEVNDWVTEKMVTALENMRGGVDRWLENSDG